MAKTLGKALGTDLNEVAALLRSKGRGRDTVLAHIMPEEAALLKRMGGRESINPDTGLPEYESTWWNPSTWFGGDTQVETPVQEPEQAPTQVETEPAQQDWGISPADAASWFQDYQKQFTQPIVEAPQAGGFGTPEPFVGVPKFAAAPQFGAGGVEVSPGYAAEQLDKEIAAQQQPPADKGALQKFEQAVKEYPATTSALANLTKFGLGGLATIPLMRQQQRAAQNTQAMADEIAALGAPIRQQGTQMLSQAQAGQLTPEQQQRVQALRAQQNQSLARQGVTSGVAQQQAEANVQRLTQQFVANNITNALNMVNIGNNYARSAITQGYNANQQANQAANLFYQNLFAMMGGYAPRMG